MKIEDLKEGESIDEIDLEIVEKQEEKQIRAGLKVCNFTGKDDTGTVLVALWNDDIEKVGEGDTLKITDGWCRTFNGAKQVSTGRNGKLEVVKEEE